MNTEILKKQRQAWVRHQAEINEKKRDYTLSELKSKNYPLDLETLPKPFICEFCKTEVDPIGLVILGTIIWRQNQYCKCDQGLEKYKADAAERERIAAEEEARKRQDEINKLAKRILSESGIKNRFMSRTFDSFICNTPSREKAYNDAKYYAENFEKIFIKDGTGLYLEGTFGTGKTHLAVAIALHLINQGVNVICKTSIDLLMDIKAAFKYEGGEEDETERYKRCTLLVIDDLGKEQCTEWSLPKLYEIINDRYEKCKPTIVTTNYSHNELCRRLVPKGGDNITTGALVSRLKECAILVSMVWHDWRDGNK